MRSILNQEIQRFIQLLSASLIEFEIHIELLQDDEIFTQPQSSYLPYRYSKYAAKYFSRYNNINQNESVEFRLGFFKMNSLIAFCPLTFSLNKKSISSNGEPILLPYPLVNLTPYEFSQLYTIFIESLLIFSKGNGFKPLSIQEYELELSDDIVNLMIQKGFSFYSRDVFFKTCSGNRSDLWVGIRKSYKACINKGLRELEIAVVSGNEAANKFDEFRNLHLEVSGRVTRSPETWNIQKAELLSGFAKLICIFLEGNLVGCSFISFNRSSALYSVGVYRRELSHLHLGHLAQWCAIEELNKVGIFKYRLGHLDSSLERPISSKEISIGQFKKGFANRITQEKTFYETIV